MSLAFMLLLNLLQAVPAAPSVAPATPVEDVDVIGSLPAGEGAVQLECDVQPTGHIVGCRILQEIPLGQGFGEAALRGARRARLTPAQIDGVAKTGKVRFTTRFRLQE